MTVGGADTATREQERRAAADKTLAFLAWDAVQAMLAYEQSIRPDPTARRAFGAEFARAWDEFGLTVDDFSDTPTRQQQILTAARRLAQGDGGLTVAAAVGDVLASSDPPASTTAADVMRSLHDEGRTVYGNSSRHEPVADRWLTESLGRLAIGAVLRDIVRTGAVVQPDQQARGRADQILQNAIETQTGASPVSAGQIAEAILRAKAEVFLEHGRQVLAGLADVQTRAAAVDGTGSWSAVVATGGTIGAGPFLVETFNDPSTPLPQQVATTAAVAIAIISASVLTHGAERGAAARALSASQGAFLTARNSLATALDTSPFGVRAPGQSQPAPRGGRPAEGPQRDGGFGR